MRPHLNVPDMPRPYILAETNWQVVKDTAYDVAILPWGATEAHNYHLPYATDNYQNESVTAAAAQLAWEQGAKVVVLPNVPFGINTGQLDIPLCLNLNPQTQMQVLRDLADVVLRAGIKKLVILNGHGGNHFKLMIRDLSFQQPDLFVCAMNWFDAAGAWDQYFEDLGDHAGELETSVMMHIQPELVMPLEQAGDGRVKRWNITALREGWVSSERKWTAVSADTGVGNPGKASADKGARYLQACTQRIAEFWVELARTSLDDLYTD